MQKINTRKYIWIIGITGLLIFLHFIGVLAPIESFIVSIFRPVLGGFYSVSSDLRVAYNEQTDKRDLISLVKQLEVKVNQLTAENAKLKVLEEENQILREYLKFPTNEKANYIISNIISRGGLGGSIQQYQSIIIDKGEKDGLFDGLAVVSSQGIIVGKVMAVKDHLSEVYLTTNPSCKLAATIQNQDKTSGIVQGELGLTIRMEFIPQTEEIKVGDIVITSGLEQNIPRGLIIGKVTQVTKESNELWQSAVIEPLVDLDELIIVSVLLP